MKNIWSILALGLVLAGCGQFYWSRPAATLDDFATDHRACVRAVGVSSGPRYDGAMPKGENVGAAGKAVAIGVGVLTRQDFLIRMRLAPRPLALTSCWSRPSSIGNASRLTAGDA